MIVEKNFRRTRGSRVYFDVRKVGRQVENGGYGPLGGPATEAPIGAAFGNGHGGETKEFFSAQPVIVVRHVSAGLFEPVDVHPGFSFAPPGLVRLCRATPTACAVGCILTRLRGYIRPAFSCRFAATSTQLGSHGPLLGCYDLQPGFL